MPVQRRLPTLASCDSNQQTAPPAAPSEIPLHEHTQPQRGPVGVGVYFCERPHRKIQPHCDHTRATGKGGRAWWGERSPLILPLCKGQRLVETWGSGCCRSEIQGSVAKWRERKRERGRGRGNGNPSFGGQGSHAPLLIKIINNVRMEGSPLGPQLATYPWISFPARAPVLVSLLACSSVFRGSQAVSAPPPQ